MEEKLDNLSSTLEVMKDFFIKGSLSLPSASHSEKDESDGKEMDRKKAGPGKEIMVSSPSEVTVYHNVLQQIEDTGDPAITFNMRPRHRGSSSLEDHIDTSDEMIKVEMEINEQFIVDCQKEVRQSMDDADRHGANDVVRDQKSAII